MCQSTDFEDILIIDSKASQQARRNLQEFPLREYGARIHKDGKTYTYGPVVTQQNGKGVDLPALQKNDVGDIHTHNYGVGDDAHANSIEQPDRISSVQDKATVQKINGGAGVDYDS